MKWLHVNADPPGLNVSAHGSRTRNAHVWRACFGSWIKNEENACVVRLFRLMDQERGKCSVVRLFGPMDQERGKCMCSALVSAHGSRTR